MQNDEVAKVSSHQI